MRTTLRLDDDVLLAAKELARRQSRTAGEVISELVRQALHARNALPEGDGDSDCLGIRPFPRRGGLVTDDQVDSIREDDGI